MQFCSLDDEHYCPCVGGDCPFLEAMSEDGFECERDCPYWTNEF